jgi:hypothetical protein
VAQLSTLGHSNIMRVFSTFLAFVAVLFTGYAQNLKDSDTKPSVSILGTWQGVSNNQILLKPEDGLVYERYYPDGRYATWYKDKKQNPHIPKNNYEYHLTYSFIGKALIYDSDRDGKPERTVEVKKDEMTMTIISKDETNVLISHRVFPDLDPGKFPSDQSTNGTSKL